MLRKTEIQHNNYDGEIYKVNVQFPVELEQQNGYYHGMFGYVNDKVLHKKSKLAEMFEKEIAHA